MHSVQRAHLASLWEILLSLRSTVPARSGKGIEELTQQARLYVGKPVRFSDLPLHINNSANENNYPDFSRHRFEICAQEPNKEGRMSIVTEYFKFCKLHLTDLNGKKIVKMCSCYNCYAYEVQE